MQPKTYIPGVCNIGPQEKRLRVVAGWIGLIVTVVVAFIFVYIQASTTLRLVIFLPATFSAMGFLQAAFNFCVAFGTRGLFNVANPAGQTAQVTQSDFRKIDQRKAVQIIIYSVVIGVLVTILMILL